MKRVRLLLGNEIKLLRTAVPIHVVAMLQPTIMYLLMSAILVYPTFDMYVDRPTTVEGHALVAGCDEFLHVLNIADGKSQRQVSMMSVSGASAAIAGDEVFVGTYDGQARCINWKTGATKWVFETAERKFPFMSSAAVTSQAVILGGRDKRLWALNPADGKPLWQFAAKGQPLAQWLWSPENAAPQRGHVRPLRRCAFAIRKRSPAGGGRASADPPPGKRAGR